MKEIGTKANSKASVNFNLKKAKSMKVLYLKVRKMVLVHTTITTTNFMKVIFKVILNTVMANIITKTDLFTKVNGSKIKSMVKEY